MKVSEIYFCDANASKSYKNDAQRDDQPIYPQGVVVT